MYVYQMYVWYLQGQEESIGKFRTTITDSSELLCWCWVLNPGPLQAQQVLLTAEPCTALSYLRNSHCVLMLWWSQILEEYAYSLINIFLHLREEKTEQLLDCKQELEQIEMELKRLQQEVCTWIYCIGEWHSWKLICLIVIYNHDLSVTSYIYIKSGDFLLPLPKRRARARNQGLLFLLFKLLQDSK